MSILSFVDIKREELNVLLSEEGKLRNSSLIDLKISKETKEKRLKEIAKEVHSIRQSIKYQQKEDYDNYESPLAEYLPNRDKEELLVAEDILNNDIEYKYKSDKVKAFLKFNIPVESILSILNLRADTQVTLSYINQIKEKN